MKGKDLGGPVLDTRTFEPTDWLAVAQTQSQHEEVKWNLRKMEPEHKQVKAGSKRQRRAYMETPQSKRHKMQVTWHSIPQWTACTQKSLTKKDNIPMYSLGFK